MSIRLLRSLRVSLFQDKDTTPAIFDRTEGRAFDESTEHNGGSMLVPAATSRSLPFGDVVTARVLFISSDVPISVTLNGGSPLALSVPESGIRAALYLEATITSCSVQNAGADDAAVIYTVVG